MREILFKAKRLDNREWVEGYYFTDLSNNHFIKIARNNRMGSFEINHNTLCQFTGMTDRNGNKIWENNIIESQKFSTRLFSKNGKHKRFIGVVEYHTDIFEDTNQIYEAEWKVKFNEEDISKYPYGSYSDFWDCKIIGNKFDSSELLKGDN